MKVTTRFQGALKKDTHALLSTAGVLGETFVDLDSRGATGALAQNGDTLTTKSSPQLQDVVRSSQGTLENVDILVRRVDRILTQIESGNGSIGRLIYDEKLYDRLNATLNEVQSMVTQISEGRGSIGKLIASDELYNKMRASIDNLDKIIDEINQGNGTWASC